MRELRGSRLADARCPQCGGPLKGMTAGRPSGARGRKYLRCELCGTRKLTLWRITRDDVTRPVFGEPAYREVPVPKGTLACPGHWVCVPPGPDVWRSREVRDVGEPVEVEKGPPPEAENRPAEPLGAPGTTAAAPWGADSTPTNLA
jgi:hypothetical protein